LINITTIIDVIETIYSKKESDYISIKQDIIIDDTIINQYDNSYSNFLNQYNLYTNLFKNDNLNYILDLIYEYANNYNKYLHDLKEIEILYHKINTILCIPLTYNIYSYTKKLYLHDIIMKYTTVSKSELYDTIIKYRYQAIPNNSLFFILHNHEINQIYKYKIKPEHQWFLNQIKMIKNK